MPQRPRLSSYQLKIQALLILYQIAQHRRTEAFPRTWTLRFILAFLYSQSNGDRSSFDAYWKAATRPRGPDETEAEAASVRGADLRREANRICVALGEQPKQIWDQFWDELTREAYAKRGEDVTILK